MFEPDTFTRRRRRRRNSVRFFIGGFALLAAFAASGCNLYEDDGSEPPVGIPLNDKESRSASSHNMMMVMIAMHSYHDANLRFPAAVMLGPDGKTTHSWRVALLPYLNKKALYDEYNLDEPWDSANNLKVLAKMPDEYRSPRSGENPDCFAGCFVITGEGACFTAKPQRGGLNFSDVAGGTHSTIAMVEAKRDIPWAKPEDIPYEAGTQLPDLGGFYDDGFFAALMNGAVRFIPSAADPEKLELLIQYADGQTVNIDEL